MEKPNNNIYTLKLQLQIEQNKRLLAYYRHEITKGNNLKTNMLLNGAIGLTDVAVVNCVCNKTALEAFDHKLKINDVTHQIRRNYISMARINLNERDLSEQVYERNQEKISITALRVDMKHEETKKLLIHEKEQFKPEDYRVFIEEIKSEPMQMLMTR